MRGCSRLSAHVPNSNVERPPSDLMGLGVAASRRGFGHKDAALVNGISALRKETPQRSFALACPASKKSAISEPGSGLSLMQAPHTPKRKVIFLRLLLEMTSLKLSSLSSEN